MNVGDEDAADRVAVGLRGAQGPEGPA
jgi:hypothetical protein